MRNSKVKYAGAIVAIIGLLVLAILGFAYAWSDARNFSEIGMADYTVHAIIGAIMLICGVLAYIFVEE